MIQALPTVEEDNSKNTGFRGNRQTGAEKPTNGALQLNRRTQRPSLTQQMFELLDGGVTWGDTGATETVDSAVQKTLAVIAGENTDNL